MHGARSRGVACTRAGKRLHSSGTDSKGRLGMGVRNWLTVPLCPPGPQSQDMRTHRADAAPPLPPPPPEPPLDLDLGLGPGSGATGQQDKGPAGRGADNKAEGAEGKGAGGAAADGADAEATGGPKGGSGLGRMRNAECGMGG